MEKIGCFVIIFCAIFNVVDVAMVTAEDDKPVVANYAYKTSNFMTFAKDDEDLAYSDFKSYVENRRQIYQHMRDYGVPSDVAQLYVPRITIGEFLGNDKDQEKNNDEDDDSNSSSKMDPWTIVWYIGSFGGLIAFFLVVSCSEWCCIRRRQARQQSATGRSVTRPGRGTTCPGGVERVRATSRPTCETPPPSYHLFAPPPYDSINYEEKTEKFDVFVVPVHAVTATHNFLNSGPVQNENTAPPEYTEISIPPPS